MKADQKLWLGKRCAVRPVFGGFRKMPPAVPPAPVVDWTPPPSDPWVRFAWGVILTGAIAVGVALAIIHFTRV